MNITWTSSGAGPRAVVLLVLAALLCLVPTAAATTTPGPDATPDPATEDPTAGVVTGEVTVSLTDVSPAVLTPGEDLVVRGTVTNGTGTEIAVPELRLRAQQSAPISRSLLERWLDPTSLSATTLLHAERLEDPVAAGESVAFTLTVPADAVPFAPTYSGWGPRGIEVTAHDADAPVLTDVPATRSFLLWWPDLEVETMPLAVLAAAAPTAPERAAAQESGTRLDAVAAERLEPLLAALDRPAVDLAVDPSLLVDVPGVVDLTAGEPADEEPTEEPSAPSTTPKTALRATLGDFADAPGRTVHALLWADADAAALTHADRTDLLGDVMAARDTALEEVGLAAGTGLAWPAADTPDADTVTALSEAGATAVVLPSSSLAPTSQLTYTPSARAGVAVDGATLPAVLADERLSALLAGTLLPVAPDQAPVELDPVTARQYLLAETAVVTRERPADRRDLLLTVPRDFAGDAEVLADQLTALAQAPWLERVGLAEMLGREAPDVERENLPETVVEDGEVDAAELDRVTDVLERTAAFAGVLEEPEALVDPVRASLLEVTSAAWRQLPGTRAELIDAAEDASAARRHLVAARPGSTLNLINEEAHIPVAVTNEMSRPAHVVVRLSPRDPRLVADEEVALEIPPEQSATAQVPVHAVGSGNVVVDVVLTAPDGTPIDEPTEIQVRVRADWETVGTAVAAGLLVIMLVAGLVRTVRRARRRGRLGDSPEETTT
ncbi:hypothetical protein SAMN05216184_12232 [Georgenia satyanarayanai]|uniref:Glycoprotein n=1 Tax=Georgenia satyanarayanai TaxID=860221 RepID=A0A2Y9ARU9_9MICO|nr:DUF6049 family protein [Georgenia satyanarayanai]PYF96278.1 hypothetical protein A8987_12232 [Georgenia satyanarayanai]SSA47114.1 hypothetical protein SAMN05216184_12232 [Georgenia satyanarayanai]